MVPLSPPPVPVENLVLTVLRGAQELTLPSGTILERCVVEDQRQAQPSKPSGALKLVGLHRKALQKAGLEARK